MLIPVLLLWPRRRKGVWWCKADVCIWVHDIPCARKRKEKRFLGFWMESISVQNPLKFVCCATSTSNFRIIQQLCAYFRASNKIKIKRFKLLVSNTVANWCFWHTLLYNNFPQTEDLTKNCRKKKKNMAQGNSRILSHYCKQEYLLKRAK